MHFRSRSRFLFAALVAVFTIVPSSYAKESKPKHLIKFASVAPDGTTWMKIMRELDKDVREATNNEVGFKMYPGGVQGDEPDVLRKMRFGQLHAAGFTGVGIGDILPSARILELPFLYRDKAEIDHIIDKFTDYFDEEFRKKGYVLLGWTEVGYVYFFSNSPVHNLHDVKGMKLWTWQGDPLAAALMEALDITPISLSLPEVHSALQTGMIDAVYNAPMALISLQWFTQVKYMNLSPLTNSMGAILMSKKQFDKLSPESQTKLVELSRAKFRLLTELTRADNKTSIKELERSGIELLAPPTNEEIAQYEPIGIDVQNSLVGKLYSQELLDRVKAELAAYRKQQGNAR